MELAGDSPAWIHDRNRMLAAAYATLCTDMGIHKPTACTPSSLG